jgi:hypothetical protein
MIYTCFCLAEDVESPHNRSIFFHEPENIGRRRKERGLEDETIFNVLKMFDLFIRGERRMADEDFRKITDLAIYRSIKKIKTSGPYIYQSLSQLLKLIMNEAMEIIIESHGEH